jgi:hypothetical protein
MFAVVSKRTAGSRTGRMAVLDENKKDTWALPKKDFEAY